MTLDSSCEWKPIDIFPTQYLISNDGRVFSVRNKMELKPSTDKDGYLYYVMCVDGLRVTAKAHRLVAETFIPNPNGKPTVDHINAIKTDNRAENLRWATYEEQWANQNSICSHLKGAEAAARKNKGRISKYRKPIFVYKLSGEPVGACSSITEASKTFGVNIGKISECVNGKRKNACGYVFILQKRFQDTTENLKEE